MSGKKSGKFDNSGIEGLAKDKPVVYKIENSKGENIYTGSAKRGRIEERLRASSKKRRLLLLALFRWARRSGLRAEAYL